MGQTCETCVATNLEFTPLPNLGNQDFQSKLQ